MAIISASVEASGWVLRLDVTGSPGSFASYNLDPNGAPRATLSSDHAGFAASGGVAVPTTRPRAMIATRPLRVAAEVVGTVLQPFRVDETDLGGGVIRVRIALSEHIYATDTTLRLAVLAGWRSGEAAASNITVTNNSTTVAPIPIMRWALPSLSVVNGSFRLSLVAFSHHPNGFQPVAGVKFTVTDGTTVKTVWTTALATDNSMGDNLRCYTATVDPAAATALTTGLLRCDAEVYPWLGSMRSTDTAGTRAMASLRSDAVSVNAASPYVVGYDAAATRYNNLFAFVDPVNGTVTPAVGMIQSTLALAKAVAPASRPKDINTATQAAYLLNRTLGVANGVGTSQTRSVDGLQIVLAAGTHADGAGATAVTFDVTSTEIPIRIYGDPADANPRANCILQIPASRQINRVTRVLFQNMTIEQSGNTLHVPANLATLVDNCTIRGASGFTTNTIPFAAGTTTVGTWSFAMTRSRWWQTGATISSLGSFAGLVRGCEHSRLVTSVQCALKNRAIPRSEDATQPGVNIGVAFSGWAAPTLAGQAEDVIVAYNDIRSWGGRVWLPSTLPAATAGTINDSQRRQVFVGNICERIDASPEPFFGIGEGTLRTISYNIIEGNTFVGERSNTIYSDPPAATLAQVNASLNYNFVNRVAGNIFDWLPTKHDEFNSPAAAATRVANSLPNHGYRPQMIAGWSMLYGVGHEGNVDTSRTGAANFQLQYSGRRSVTGYAGALAPGYTSDRSKLGTNAGGGDYSLGANSPALSRVISGQCDVDFVGTVRPALADAGTLQTLALVLVPAKATSATIARSPVVNWSTGLLPAAGRSLHRVAPTVTGWRTSLLPVAGRSPHRVAPTLADWSTHILPTVGSLAHRAQAMTVSWSTVLVPSAAMSVHFAGATDLVLAFALAPAAATLDLFAAVSALNLQTLLTVEPANSRLIVTASLASILTAAATARPTVIVASDRRSFIPTRN